MMKESLIKVREESKKIMHLCFPATMFIMLFARWLFPRMFTRNSRRVPMFSLCIAFLYTPPPVTPDRHCRKEENPYNSYRRTGGAWNNIPLSLLMIKWGYNLPGVAVATFVSFLAERCSCRVPVVQNDIKTC
jgi:hypothetical protein